MAILNLKRKLECIVNLSRLRWGGGGLEDHKFYNTIKIVWNMFTQNSTTLQHRVSVQTAESILPLCCMQMTCLVRKKKKSPQHLYSCPFHVGDIGFFRLALLHSGSWMFQRGRLYCHLFEKAVSRRSVERKCHLKWNIIACLYFYILYKP